ncbi:hypothetical protein [Streptomyces sp. NBC_00286]|uniref:hypothetical protein n=1 Tax=Streptomyces sp. NBC_00286 TaxID=2975701 RepID=UPI002E2C52A6|nr:hypothetical protein [Streptomyces sp. NBC_00286]
MILIALLLPVFMMLLMLAMEAFEDFLFRRPDEPQPPRHLPGHAERSTGTRSVERY